MIRIGTPRLVLREQTPADAAFVLALVNDPDWLRHIGDRGVRTLDDARAYIEAGAAAMIRRHGHGLLLAETTAGVPVGLCGLLKRDGFADVDIGFAFLPAHRGLGYAREAAEATLAFAWHTLRVARVAAIVSPANAASIGLLGRLGFAFSRETTLGAETLDLWTIHAPESPSPESRTPKR